MIWQVMSEFSLVDLLLDMGPRRTSKDKREELPLADEGNGVHPFVVHGHIQRHLIPRYLHLYIHAHLYTHMPTYLHPCVSTHSL